MLDNKISVEISEEKKYPIYVEDEPISSLQEKIFRHTGANRALLVISEKVNKLYGDELEFENCYKFILKDGESQKNFENLEWILNYASKLKLERKDAIVAVGGGVVGDIAGFAAATYLRGIDFIQIPTTLLACVDSSVGGKVGINNDFGKNLVGTFYQPKAVFCNVNFLQTLDDRQLKTGVAEILKYAFIEKSCLNKENAGDNVTDELLNFNLFEFLLANPEKIFEKNINTLAEVIKLCLNLKVSVVVKDEKESGLRRILNLGHTLGHAIEKITGYKKYTHGEAVYVGLQFAIQLAFERGLISDEVRCKMFSLLAKYPIIKGVQKFDLDKLMELMKSDKKVADGKITFVLPTSKSTVECFDDITEEQIKSAYNFLFGKKG